MKRTLSRRFALAGSIAAGAMLSNSGASAANAPLPVDQTVIDAAKREGRVVWYTSLIQNSAGRPLAQAFEAKYRGIRVEIVSGTVGDILLKLLVESRTGKVSADVSHGGTSADQLRRANLIEPYLAQSAQHYPDAYKDPEGYWTAQVVNFIGPAINTASVDPGDVPKSYADLLKPQWKGKIAWSAVLAQGGPPGFIGMILKSMGKEAGTAFLEAFARQNIINVAGNPRLVLDQVIVGEYPIAVASYASQVADSVALGAPIDFMQLDPILTIEDVVFLMRNAPHPNAGRLFIEFLLSSEGQAIFRDANFVPGNPQVSPLSRTLQPRPGQPAVTITPREYGSSGDDWVEIYNRLFK